MQHAIVIVSKTLRRFEDWDCEDVRDIFEELAALIAHARDLPEDSGGRLLAEAMDILDRTCSRNWPHTTVGKITYWAADRQGRMIVSSGLFKEPRILGGLAPKGLD